MPQKSFTPCPDSTGKGTRAYTPSSISCSQLFSKIKADLEAKNRNPCKIKICGKFCLLELKIQAEKNAHVFYKGLSLITIRKMKARKAACFSCCPTDFRMPVFTDLNSPHS